MKAKPTIKQLKQHEKGMTLVFALILLAVITIVVVYSLEGSSLQSRMIINSMISNQVYQECRNELEANMIYYNRQGMQDQLLQEVNNVDGFDGEVLSDDLGSSNPPKSQLETYWRYIKMDNSAQGMAGNTIDTTSGFAGHIFEIDCDARFRFASESQTQGTLVKSLRDQSILR